MVLQNIIAALIGFVITFCWALHYILNNKSGNIPSGAKNIFWIAVRTAVLFTGIYFFCDMANMAVLVLYAIFLFSMLFLYTHYIVGIIPLIIIYVLSQWILGFPVRKDFVLKPEKLKSRKNGSPSVLIGVEGIVITALRPTGTIRINGDIHHASSDTGFIDKDSEVIVISKNGFNLVVRPADKYNG